MDRASQVLTQGVPPGVPRSYRALADHGKKAQGQQYLKPYEEEVIVKYLLQMSDFDYSIRMKFIFSLVYSITCYRSTTERPLKAFDRNWTKTLEKRYLILLARRVKVLD
ncbi:hypothetical protein BDZ45DRAFT_635332 [Acephala macrosclerotiorum]|nr:hypothetical protein BDZ45DRAFT_635332 [Acephala macrosclerotiorum]